MAVTDIILVIISVVAAFISIIAAVMSARLRRRFETSLLLDKFASKEEAAHLAAMVEQLRAAKSAEQADAILAQMNAEIASLRAKQPKTEERPGKKTPHRPQS